MKAQNILFYFALVLVTVSVGGDAPKEEDLKDVKLEGSYELVTDPDNDKFTDYLRAMDFSEESRKEIRANKKITVTIKDLNSTSHHVKMVSKGKPREMTFISGKAFESKLADGRQVNNTISVNYYKKSARRTIMMKGFNATNEAKFSKEGFNVTLKAQAAVAELEFKRVGEGEADIVKGDTLGSAKKKLIVGRK